MKIWNLTNGSLIHTLYGHAKSVTRLAFETSNNYLASRSEDSIKIWNLTNIGDRMGESTNNNSKFTFSNLDLSSNLVFFENELKQLFLASGSLNGQLSIWDLHSGQLKTKLNTTKAEYFPVYVLLKLGDSNLLASGGGDVAKNEASLKIWNISSLNANPLVCSFDTLNGTHRASVVTLVSLPNSLLASYAWDDTIKIWNVSSQSLLYTFKSIVGNGALSTIPLHYLGQNLLAAGGWRYIKVYDISIGVLKFQLDEYVNAIYFDYIHGLDLKLNAHGSLFLVSKGGSVIEVGGKPTINVWNLARNQTNFNNKYKLSSFTGGLSGFINSQVIVSDQLLASGWDDGTIKVWKNLF